jgi:hypothetical protein
MKITINSIAFAFFVVVVGLAFIALTEKPIRGNAATGRTVENASPSHSVVENSPSNPGAVTSLATPPFIVQDTLNDSPGTNLVTRIVTFSAQVSGTPPLVLQWKVDTGSGYKEIPGATNATYRIGNAQVEHNGLYALFATNSAGSTNTSPQQLIVTEGED